MELLHFILGFPGALVVKNLPANAGDLGLIPGLGSSPGEGRGNPFQSSCLGNAMDRAWWATVHGWQRAGHDGARTHTHTHTHKTFSVQV